MIEKKDLFEARTNGYWTYRIPGIAVTKNDTVLVTAEARPGQGGDYDFNDVLMRRSSDGGQTFGPVVKIVDHETYGDGPASNFVMIPDRDSGRVVAVFHHDYARAFTLYSDDEGATWSEPLEITDVFKLFKSDYAWRVCANGCGHGLQLRNGRMIVPVWLSDGSGSEFGGKHRGHRPSIVTLITSDDGGRSWQRGGIVSRQGDRVGGETVHNASETSAVELEDGSIMFNIRTESQTQRRLVSVSSDGGDTWGEYRWDAALLDPVCMAGLMRYNWASDGRSGCILFSNPDNLDKTMATWAMDRKRLSIKLSNDDGSTWPVTCVLEEGPAGYSTLAKLSDGTVLCLYEADIVTRMCDDRYLRLARFDMNWLTNKESGRHRLLTLASGRCSRLEPPMTNHFDLIVYDATPGGLACAIRAAREGLNVLLVDHLQHLGGFLTCGAGGWETPCDTLRSPIYREVLNAITDHYRDTYGEGSPQHLASMPQRDSRRHIDRAKVEPRIAEQVFEQLIGQESRITVWRGWYPVAAQRDGVQLTSVTLRQMNGEESREVSAAIFADASYTGDLAAVAGVPYRVGREARDEYGEPHAGRVFIRHRATPSGQAGWPVDSTSGLLNLRTFGHTSGDVLLESSGEADDAVMAYNYRLILTDDPANRLPAPKPDDYDPARYRDMGWSSIVPNLPNRKIAWNAGRLIGPQHAYPEGDWQTRHSIDRQYRNAILGLLYYLQNDPAVPVKTREFWQPYGLPRDEFPDNDHMPYEVYVREGRRILGRYVFTEHDGLPVADGRRTPSHADSIATTDWPIDSVACHETTIGDSAMDGIYFLAEQSRPAQVPYRCMLPQGLDNLLIPVCLSSSHVGWGPLRLEPVWMQTGEAAGFAAALAIEQSITPAMLDTRLLVRTMVEQRCMVSFFNDIDVASDDAWVPAMQVLGTLGLFDTYDARPHDLLGDLTDAWQRHWRKLSVKAGSLSPDMTRAAAAMTIYSDISLKPKRNLS